MNHHIEPHVDSAVSPFDAVKRTTSECQEFWSARDLMPMLGYSRWQDFSAAIDRAKIAAEVQGMDVAEHFVPVREETRGRPRMDYHLTRRAVDLIVANAHVNKLEVMALKLGVHPDEIRKSSAPVVEYVYFIEASAVGMVKIGTARNPQDRMRILQIGSPVPLRLVGTIPGGRLVEKRFHSTFRAYCSHGEWFHMTAEIQDYIDSLTAGKVPAHV